MASAAPVNFRLDRSHSAVTLTLTDELGRVVRTIAGNQPMAEGNHVLHMKTDALSAGIYMLTLEADGITRATRIVVQQ